MVADVIRAYNLKAKSLHSFSNSNYAAKNSSAKAHNAKAHNAKTILLMTRQSTYICSTNLRSPPKASPQMSKNRTELSDYEKGQINALHKVGLNPTQISRQINRPRQTIMNYLNREERGTHENE